MERSMFPILVLFIILFLANAIQLNPALAATSQDQEQLELPSPAICNELIESTLPAIVQFSYDGFGNGQLHFGCGVIISPEGHIAVSGPVGAVLDNNLLELRLADGRKVRGEALGWSGEFGFGMLKITEPGVWPFVKFSDRLGVGEVCLALGYLRNADDNNIRPQTNLALVTKVSKDNWFVTSNQSDFSAHPVFNLRGELLGLCVSLRHGKGSIHSNSRVIINYWNELVAGQNLDRKRLLDEVMPPKTLGKPPEKMGEEVFAKASAASVQIGDVGDKPVFSGVMIPNAYVITCAHHGRLPGTVLRVHFADGRSANSVVLGTNWLNDICVLKIADEGNWPCVDLGYSSLLSTESPVVLIGYPVKNNQKPLVLESRLIEPTNRLKRRDDWNEKIHCICDDEEIVRNLGGASGGGLFDNSGNVIGVLNSTAGNAIQFSRVELFHKHWPELTANETFVALELQIHDRTLPALEKLMKDMSKLP
jgi:S1-C subfamily serine protease